jgi:hypothetical protein
MARLSRWRDIVKVNVQRMLVISLLIFKKLDKISHVISYVVTYSLLIKFGIFYLYTYHRHTDYRILFNNVKSVSMNQ